MEVKKKNYFTVYFNQVMFEKANYKENMKMVATLEVGSLRVYQS